MPCGRRFADLGMVARLGAVVGAVNRYRKLGRRDANEGPIIDALRAFGCSVKQTHDFDLVCGYRGKNVILEVKDPAKPPSARKLTEDQAQFIATWRGQYAVVHSPEEAIREVIAATLI